MVRRCFKRCLSVGGGGIKRGVCPTPIPYPSPATSAVGTRIILECVLVKPSFYTLDCIFMQICGEDPFFENNMWSLVIIAKIEKNSALL